MRRPAVNHEDSTNDKVRPFAKNCNAEFPHKKQSRHLSPSHQIYARDANILAEYLARIRSGFKVLTRGKIVGDQRSIRKLNFGAMLRQAIIRSFNWDSKFAVFSGFSDFVRRGCGSVFCCCKGRERSGIDAE